MKNFGILFLIIASSYGCKQKKNVSRNEMISYSKSYIGKVEYENILKSAEDTVDSWLLRNSSKLKYVRKNTNRKIDDMVCINKTKDKAILFELNNTKTSPLDDVILVYGVNIKGIWYFFYGPTFTFAKYDESNFKILSEYAFEKVYKGYLFRNQNGELEINNNFFSDFTSIAWKSKTGVRPWDKESWDQLYLDLIEENRLKIDTMDYSKLE